jgi:hypothetical protein
LIVESLVKRDYCRWIPRQEYTLDFFHGADAKSYCFGLTTKGQEAGISEQIASDYDFSSVGIPTSFTINGESVGIVGLNDQRHKSFKQIHELVLQNLPNEHNP